MADIARVLRKRYSHVWSEARKLMTAAEVVTPRPYDVPDACVEIEVLELFADLQSIVPEHLRR